MLMSFCEHLQ